MKKRTMPKNSDGKFQKSEDGFVTLETLPLLLIFVMLISYSIGSFGIVHSGILNSIAARTYAFETFRHRTNVSYLRGNGNGGSLDNYRTVHFRLHVVQSESGSSNEDQFIATERKLTFGYNSALQSKSDEDAHNIEVYSDKTDYGVRNTAVAVNPVRLITQYGICLDAICTTTQ